MRKEFYTEKDIEDLFQQGVRSLSIGDNVVLTELAYEKASRLGIQLTQNQADTPPSAPVRPYLSQPSIQTKAILPASEPTPSLKPDLEARIRNAVIARLGNQIDSGLLNTIIQGVLKTTGLK
jgi:hypothetical protein